MHRYDYLSFLKKQKKNQIKPREGGKIKVFLNKRIDKERARGNFFVKSKNKVNDKHKKDLHFHQIVQHPTDPQRCLHSHCTHDQGRSGHSPQLQCPWREHKQCLCTNAL